MILNKIHDVIELNSIALKMISVCGVYGTKLTCGIIQRSTAPGDLLCQAHLISMSFCPCSWFTVKRMASVTRTHQFERFVARFVSMLPFVVSSPKHWQLQWSFHGNCRRFAKCIEHSVDLLSQTATMWRRHGRSGRAFCTLWCHHDVLLTQICYVLLLFRCAVIQGLEDRWHFTLHKE